MEITSAADYKAKLRQLVKLPSQSVFEIRKMPRSIFFELGSTINKIQDVKPRQKLTQDQIQAFDQLYDKVIIACVTQPTVVKGKVKKGQLSIDDVEAADQTFLVTKIFEFSGLTEKADELRKKSPEVK